MLRRTIIVCFSVSVVSTCSRLDAIFKRPETIESIQQDALESLTRFDEYLDKAILYTKGTTAMEINANLKEIGTLSARTASCVRDEAHTLVPEAIETVENSVKGLKDDLMRLKNDLLRKVQTMDEAEELRLKCEQVRRNIAKKFQKEVEKALSPVFESLEAKVAHCIKEDIRRLNATKESPARGANDVSNE